MTLSALPRRLFLASLQRGFAATLGAKHAAFLAGCRFAGDIERTQKTKLAEFLKANAETHYGKTHRYGAHTTVEAFQKHVPIVDYDSLEPYVNRIAAGTRAELTREDVLMLERTGGSTSTTKLIPYTQALKNEFSAATDVWMADLYRNRPGLFGGTSYFAISPVGELPCATSGGLPIGFEDDAAYFPPLARWVWRHMMSVPPEVAREPDIDAWRFATCRHLLADANLGFLSVWSPTFLTGLTDFLTAHFDELLKQLPVSRARELAAARSRAGGQLSGSVLWPRLAVVSCWADGISESFALPVRAFFGNSYLQPKGLLATEGVVTFPLHVAPGSRTLGSEIARVSNAESVNVLAYTSHFLEFLDLDATPGKPPLLAHELRAGGTYSPLLTTGGGFARYHLKDALTCEGFEGALPCLRFVGKTDRTADLFGEKINMRQIEHGLALARERTGASWRFALVAPTFPWRYTLFLETDDDDASAEQVASILEEYLLTGHHYAYCLRLGQLAPLQWKRVAGGQAKFEAHLIGLGARPGTIKPAVLDGRTGWDAVFESASNSDT